MEEEHAYKYKKGYVLQCTSVGTEGIALIQNVKIQPRKEVSHYEFSVSKASLRDVSISICLLHPLSWASSGVCAAISYAPQMKEGFFESVFDRFADLAGQQFKNQ